MHGLCQEVVSLFSAVSEEKDLSLRLAYSQDTPELISADPARLRQIISNLLNNAIQFTESGSIKLSVSPRNIGAQTYIHVSVTDTGIGIPEAQLNLLFDRLSKERNRYEGSGLGLSIVKQIVELMGGRVGVESLEGKGSTFWFAFPLEHATAQTPADDQHNTKEPNMMQATQSLAGRKVLIAEDNVVNRCVLFELLNQQKMIIIEAEDGFTAVEQYNAEKPDIVLMDIAMPHMDGLVATATIMDTEYWKLHRTPIIAVSAHVMPEDQKKCLSMGMVGFVGKPVDKELLFSTMSHHLQGRLEATG